MFIFYYSREAFGFLKNLYQVCQSPEGMDHILGYDWIAEPTECCWMVPGTVDPLED